ncbi:MAG: PRC-barrel domain-containing protein [Chloroflexota bacterium]
MIYARELRGRPVIDVGKAAKVGEVDDLVLNPDGRNLVALVITKGRSLLGSGHQLLVDSDSIEAIGPDAITVREITEYAHDAGTASLLRLSEICGLNVVTENGRHLGAVQDVLLEAEGRGIIGYVFGRPNPLGSFGELMGGKRDEPRADPEYVRADAHVRIGDRLLLVPDGAIVRESPHERESVGRDRPASSQEDRRREDVQSNQPSTIILPGHDTSASDSAAVSPDRRDIQQ